MNRNVVLPLIALSVSAFVLPAVAASNDPPAAAAGMERMQHWTLDHETLLNAKLAGLKAGLKLTPDQDKLWTPFEAAIRSGAQLRMQHMSDRMQAMQTMRANGDEADARSPVDRLETMADRMTEGAAALKKIADAAKPFYASLDDSQKHVFGWLGRELLMMGRGPHGPGMAMMGYGHGMGPDGIGPMMGPDGMGQMEHGGMMPPWGHPRGPGEDNSDDE
jgi:zinc resistance-associated protein